MFDGPWYTARDCCVLFMISFSSQNRAPPHATLYARPKCALGWSKAFVFSQILATVLHFLGQPAKKLQVKVDICS